MAAAMEIEESGILQDPQKEQQMAQQQIPEAPIGDDWTDYYDAKGHDPQELLRRLPSNKEMFYDSKTKGYWIRQKKKTKPRLEDLVS